MNEDNKLVIASQSTIQSALKDVAGEVAMGGKEKVIFGKDDQTISIFDGITNSLFMNKPTYVNQSATSGFLKIPTDRENDFIVQWGEFIVDTETTTQQDFTIPFPNKCYIVLPVHTSNNIGVTFMADSISNNQFEFELVGGSGSEVFKWVAIGY